MSKWRLQPTQQLYIDALASPRSQLPNWSPVKLFTHRVVSWTNWCYLGILSYGVICDIAKANCYIKLIAIILCLNSTITPLARLNHVSGNPNASVPQRCSLVLQVSSWVLSVCHIVKGRNFVLWITFFSFSAVCLVSSLFLNEDWIKTESTIYELFVLLNVDLRYKISIWIFHPWNFT